MKFDVTLTISVDDGIVNVAPCVVKSIKYIDSNSPVPSIIWVKFENEEQGIQTRKHYQSYFTIDICRTLTPIFACKRTFTYGQNHIAIARLQFPLRPASAKTIHKEQGLSVKKLVVNMGSGIYNGWNALCCFQ